MPKTEIITIYPGIPTDEVLDVAWHKKHTPDFAAWVKAYPHLLEKTEAAKAEAAEKREAPKSEDKPAPKGKE